MLIDTVSRQQQEALPADVMHMCVHISQAFLALGAQQ